MGDMGNADVGNRVRNSAHSGDVLASRLWLSDVRVARIVVEAIRAGESRKFYELSAWVVMPNHVHLLILPQVALPQITQWIKGRTAREANVLLGRVGQRSGSMNPTITGSGMRRSCSGSRRMSKRIRSRLGWPLLLRIGIFKRHGGKLKHNAT